MKPLLSGVFIPNDQKIWLYRGVHGQHPMIAAARQRVVIPGDREGTISPQVHNEGMISDLAVSPFTSWTTNIHIARERAAAHSGGVILRLPRVQGQDESWSWVYSPDAFLESEILLRGVRIDAEVVR